MSLEVTKEEYARLQEDLQWKQSLGNKIKDNRRGGRQKIQKWQQQRREGTRITKQITSDIEPIENTWLRSVTRLQYNEDTGRAYVQAGISIRNRGITFVSSLGVVDPEKEDRIWR